MGTVSWQCKVSKFQALYLCSKGAKDFDDDHDYDHDYDDQ